MGVAVGGAHDIIAVGRSTDSGRIASIPEPMGNMVSDPHAKL